MTQTSRRPLGSGPARRGSLQALQHCGARLGLGLLLLATGVLGPGLHSAQADTAGDIRALAVRGDLPGALRLADQALLAAPQDGPLKFTRAVLLMDLQRDAEALRGFTELSQAYPELPDPHNNLALLHARAGRLQEALQSLQLALRNDPTHRLARINLGQVHLMLAAHAWDEAAAAGPLEPDVRRRLEAVRALLLPAVR